MFKLLKVDGTDILPDEYESERDAVRDAIDKRKSLRSAILRGADLSHMQLQGVDFSHAMLKDANLSRSNLSDSRFESASMQNVDAQYVQADDAEFLRATLKGANFSGAVMHRVRFPEVKGDNMKFIQATMNRAYMQNFHGVGCDFTGAMMRNGDISYSDMEQANFGAADLDAVDMSSCRMRYSMFDVNTNLEWANLRDVNLSGCVGLIDPSDWMEENFERTDEGYRVFKVFGKTYISPEHWFISPGSVIREVVNPNRTVGCACGVNFAHKEWFGNDELPLLWECLLEWRDLPAVVVPFNTDGKARCSRLTLVGKVEED